MMTATVKTVLIGGNYLLESHTQRSKFGAEAAEAPAVAIVVVYLVGLEAQVHMQK
jgi:hypothetical protein